MSSTPEGRIPFVDLARQHASLEDALQKAFADTVRESGFVLGARVETFEKSFAQWTGARYAVGVASGTDALQLALRALSIGPGDEVIVPAMTFAATALAVLYTGATPVAIDVREDGLIDPRAVEGALTAKTKAVIPVHLYGKPCDLKALERILAPKGIPIVEDACQAHGARVGTQRVGTLGKIGCFSFFPSKNLGALGDGGIAVTNDESAYRTLLGLRNYGQRVRYHHDSLGFNSRLDGLQAALLSVKLPHLDRWNDARRTHAKRYLAGLQGLPLALLCHSPSPENDHIVHLFVVRTTERDALRDHLTAAGIETGIHYPFSIPQLGVAKGKVRSGPTPQADALAREGLSLPMFPELTEGEIDRVVSSIRQFFASRPIKPAAGKAASR